MGPRRDSNEWKVKCRAHLLCIFNTDVRPSPQRKPDITTCTMYINGCSPVNKSMLDHWLLINVEDLIRYHPNFLPHTNMGAPMNGRGLPPRVCGKQVWLYFIIDTSPPHLANLPRHLCHIIHVITTTSLFTPVTSTFNLVSPRNFLVLP